MSEKRLIVGPLSAVNDTVRAANVQCLVTLINGETHIATPESIAPGNHLRLSMNDIIEPQQGLVPPSENHVVELVEFAKSWDREQPMMIHCWAGISRSTAAAFITLCTLNPGRDERAIAKTIREASATATPNRRLVHLADSLLQREGRMLDAVDLIGRGEMTFEADVFELDATITA